MDTKQAEKVLKSPATHRLVFEVLALADTHDIVDAIADLQIAREILKAKINGFGYSIR